MNTPTVIVAPDGRRFYAFLDVSGYQFHYAGNGGLVTGAQRPDYRKAAAAGFAGVIGRIGNGTTRDQSFAHGYPAAKDAGLAVGAYYYAQPNVTTGPAGARLVASWLTDLELDVPVMLDLESYYGPRLAPDAYARWIRDHLAELEQLLRRPMVYGGAAFLNPGTVAGTLEAWDTVQARYPRMGTPPPRRLDEWAAWIPWAREPVYTPTLGRWDAWQFSSDADWPAYGGPADAAVKRVDVNIVPVDVWQRWTAGDVKPPPTPPPSQKWSSPMSALYLADPERRLVDTRRALGMKRPKAGVTFELELPADHAPTAAVITCTVVRPDGEGYLTVWGDHEPPNSSTLNYAAGAGPIANTTLVAVGRNAAGRPVVRGAFAHNAADLIVDLVGVIA